jgi:hypothetical protein
VSSWGLVGLLGPGEHVSSWGLVGLVGLLGTGEHVFSWRLGCWGWAAAVRCKGGAQCVQDRGPRHEVRPLFECGPPRCTLETTIRCPM